MRYTKLLRYARFKEELDRKDLLYYMKVLFKILNPPLHSVRYFYTASLVVGKEILIKFLKNSFDCHVG